LMRLDIVTLWVAYIVKNYTPFWRACSAFKGKVS
jgi:hypothetical protein